MNKVGLYSCTQPCNNCPYRTDAALKHWHKSEYKRLLATENTDMADIDGGYSPSSISDGLGTVYGCHKNNGSVCIGWLMKQYENNFPSIMLRISLSKNGVTQQYLDSLHSPAPLYKDVRAMVKANFPELLKRK